MDNKEFEVEASGLDENKKSSGYKTLLTSVILSSPGPLILGIGLIFGKSSTQLADFIRRTAELMAIIVSFVVFVSTNKNGITDYAKKALLEKRSNIFVGLIMCFSGSIMIGVSILSKNTEKGNVIPALCIATGGLIVNFIFWIKYTGLYKETGNVILGVQGRLYGAKTIVDTCVTSALAALVFMPDSPLSGYLDKFGSLVVSIYLIRCGIKTVREAVN